VKYFRIQPKGLEIKGHYSETSIGEEADGIHVFCNPSDIFTAIWENGMIEAYGDEILVIEAGDWWDNGDLEGVCIDPEESHIVRRLSWPEWVVIWKQAIAVDLPDVLNEEEMGEYRELEKYSLEDWDEDVRAQLLR
jgi:hypothetical protein